MPGYYKIYTSTVAMQPYIDIEGAGENVTTIEGNIGSSPSQPRGEAPVTVEFITPPPQP